jgi:hypothetical protein
MVEGFSYNAWVGDYGGITIGFVVVDRLAKSYSIALSKCTWGLRPQISRLKVSNNKERTKMEIQNGSKLNRFNFLVSKGSVSEETILRTYRSKIVDLINIANKELDSINSKKRLRMTIDHLSSN